MRRITFRGKRLDNDEFVYGMPYAMYPSLFPDGIESFEGERHLINPYTLGQFTGFFDKAGNEIFEGDVVLCFNEIRTVCYDEHYGEFEFSRHDKVENPDGLCLCCDYSECEVINNIYDYKGEKNEH
jgi:hypothetical protein